MRLSHPAMGVGGGGTTGIAFFSGDVGTLSRTIRSAISLGISSALFITDRSMVEFLAWFHFASQSSTMPLAQPCNIFATLSSSDRAAGLRPDTLSRRRSASLAVSNGFTMISYASTRMVDMAVCTSEYPLTRNVNAFGWEMAHGANYGETIARVFSNGWFPSPNARATAGTVRTSTPASRRRQGGGRAGDCLSKTWCGRRDLNPHGPFKPCGFSCRLRLSPPGRALLEGSRQVCGLDYPFTIPRKIRALGAARLVSTPSRLECRSGLGSGLPFEVSPNLSSSASPVSQASTQVFLKSAAYAIPPRPRGFIFSCLS